MKSTTASIPGRWISERRSRTFVCGHKNPVLYIGFIHEFITIYTDGTSASSIADFIDDIHEIMDRAGDEIDSLIPLLTCSDLAKVKKELKARL